MNPESRKTHLLAETVGDELVIYDERTHRAHRLSATAAVVWRLADGKKGIGDLAAGVRTAIGEPSIASGTALGATASEQIVERAIAELDRAGLLVNTLAALGEPMSRREMLGVSAALVPVVLSIVAPTPAMAQSNPITPIPGVFNFAPFNGNYSGNGAPGELNGCQLGARPVSISLSISGLSSTTGTGTMTITHQGATPFSVFPAAATVLSPASIRVQGTSVGVFLSTNTVTFTLNPNGGASAAGAQQISSPVPAPGCNSVYNVSATKP